MKQKLKNKLWKQSKYKTYFYFLNINIYESYLDFMKQINKVNLYINKKLIK